MNAPLAWIFHIKLAALIEFSSKKHANWGKNFIPYGTLPKPVLTSSIFASLPFATCLNPSARPRLTGPTPQFSKYYQDLL